ncbi:hypothetical protein KCP70_04790 [Salmonella enterica subsp. enterica]|nr:hypothetical protein KCP70_04790 [Salmonella enterica subsp. enterica]
MACSDLLGHAFRFIGNLGRHGFALKSKRKRCSYRRSTGSRKWHVTRLVTGIFFGNVWNGWLSTHLNNNLRRGIQLGSWHISSCGTMRSSRPNTPDM